MKGSLFLNNDPLNRFWHLLENQVEWQKIEDYYGEHT
jgi:hypothetical protein